MPVTPPPPTPPTPNPLPGQTGSGVLHGGPWVPPPTPNPLPGRTGGAVLGGPPPGAIRPPRPGGPPNPWVGPPVPRPGGRPPPPWAPGQGTPDNPYAWMGGTSGVNPHWSAYAQGAGLPSALRMDQGALSAFGPGEGRTNPMAWDTRGGSGLQVSAGHGTLGGPPISTVPVMPFASPYNWNTSWATPQAGWDASGQTQRSGPGLQAGHGGAQLPPGGPGPHQLPPGGPGPQHGPQRGLPDMIQSLLAARQAIAAGGPNDWNFGR